MTIWLSIGVLCSGIGLIMLYIRQQRILVHIEQLYTNFSALREYIAREKKDAENA